ncbi:MAG: cell division protein ZapA [Alphaproteobacteria bacterium HGW-Alphaproteobacteria-14]|nr:MAG: cell division protein ZapA [Alphaproteobacteria bacterium HGW-Alphaproteobacteria-14]
MSTVTLTIGPKSYTIACAEGEEAHISALGAIIAEKYAQLGTARAPLEAQNLLFAALFLADELAEARNRNAPAPETTPTPAPAADQQAIDALRTAISQLEDDLAAARAAADAPDADLSGGDAVSEALAQQLEALAARAEATASALEAAAGNG